MRGTKKASVPLRGTKKASVTFGGMSGATPNATPLFGVPKNETVTLPESPEQSAVNAGADAETGLNQLFVDAAPTFEQPLLPKAPTEKGIVTATSNVVAGPTEQQQQTLALTSQILKAQLQEDLTTRVISATEDEQTAVDLHDALEEDFAGTADDINRRLAENDDMLRKASQMVDEVRAGSIRPNQFFENKTAAGSFGAAMAVAAGEVSSALLGRPNQALNIINAAVERDIRAQEFNLQNKVQGAQLGNNLLSQARQLFHDDIAAKQYVRSLLYAQAQARIAATASRQTSQQAKSNLATLEARLAEASIQAEIKARQERVSFAIKTPIRNRADAARLSRSIREAQQLANTISGTSTTAGQQVQQPARPAVSQSRPRSQASATKEASSATASQATLNARLKNERGTPFTRNGGINPNWRARSADDALRVAQAIEILPTDSKQVVETKTRFKENPELFESLSTEPGNRNALNVSSLGTVKLRRGSFARTDDKTYREIAEKTRDFDATVSDLTDALRQVKELGVAKQFVIKDGKVNIAALDAERAQKLKDTQLAIASAYGVIKDSLGLGVLSDRDALLIESLLKPNVLAEKLAQLGNKDSQAAVISDLRGLITRTKKNFIKRFGGDLILTKEPTAGF